MIGCHGGETPKHRTSAFVIGEALAVDAGALTSGLEIADIREGETSLTTFWEAYQNAILAADSVASPGRPVRARQPMPRSLDFRMKTSG